MVLALGTHGGDGAAHSRSTFPARALVPGRAPGPKASLCDRGPERGAAGPRTRQCPGFRSALGKCWIRTDLLSLVRKCDAANCNLGVPPIVRERRERAQSRARQRRGSGRSSVPVLSEHRPTHGPRASGQIQSSPKAPIGRLPRGLLTSHRATASVPSLRTSRLPLSGHQDGRHPSSPWPAPRLPVGRVP